MAAIILGVNKRSFKGESFRSQGGKSCKWKNDVFEEREAVNADPTRAYEEPMARFQRKIRENCLYKNKRLHRVNLAERLQFESTTTLGLLRFLNQLMVFALFVAALSFSSDQGVTRGILSTLDNEFDFEGISD
eukprot:1710158-Rhodomonas_salina.1